MAINLANNNSLANITALPSSISGGAMTLLATQTASGSASLSFTSGIDDTYDSYVFKFIDIHPSSNGSRLQFNGSTDSGSNYNVIKTTTFFEAIHDEADGTTSLGYVTSYDLAQSTGNANVTQGINASGATDENGCGTLTLFNPSSNTYVKHFIITTAVSNGGYTGVGYSAGYMNTTSAINAIRFQMSSGNIDSGTIKMYGVS